LRKSPAQPGENATRYTQKVQIVVEHFRENVAPMLNGRAKAMVVVASRLEAVRWQNAIDKYIQDQGYKIATLVAFSGEIRDRDPAPNQRFRRFGKLRSVQQTSDRLADRFHSASGLDPDRTIAQFYHTGRTVEDGAPRGLTGSRKPRTAIYGWRARVDSSP
jgi:hypothetical protein